MNPHSATDQLLGSFPANYVKDMHKKNNNNKKRQQADSSPAASSDAGDAHAAAKAWGDGKLDSASAGEDAHGVIKTMAGLSPSKGSIEWDALVPSGELLP